MGKRIARQEGHDDIVQHLVFTPDDKGLLSASSDRTVIHWDLSLLKSTQKTDGLEEDISTQDLTGGLKEISRFVGHEVR